MNDRIYESARALRQYLHAHPELSGKEANTKKYLMEFLKEHTTLELMDCGKWFYAFYKPNVCKKAPIAFRADFDALPIHEDMAMFPYASVNAGVSHKCGHDGHAAALAALAMILSEEGTDREVYLIFQHAEETGEGGILCSKLLREKQIKSVYAFHNWSMLPYGAVAIRIGVSQCASVGMSLFFMGMDAHAGNPECGISPISAIMDMTAYLRTLTHEKNPVRMVTIVGISVGNQNYGISPGDGRIHLTLRTEEEETLDSLIEDIRTRAEELAKREKLSFSSSFTDRFPETKNAALSVNAVKAAADALSYPLVEMTEPLLPSEDFGYYLKETKGAMFYLGNGMDYPMLHDARYDFLDSHIERALSIYHKLLELG